MAAKRIFFPARVKGQVMTRPDAGTPACRTAGLAKVYGEGHSAVHAPRGLYLEIRAGEIVALLGSSGFGKTILLNIVGGLDRGTQGTAHFRDQCLSDSSDAQLTRADYVTENAPLVQIDSEITAPPKPKCVRSGDRRRPFGQQIVFDAGGPWRR